MESCICTTIEQKEIALRVIDCPISTDIVFESSFIAFLRRNECRIGVGVLLRDATSII